MGEGDVDLVRRIYGFDWAAVGSRREGLSELAALVAEDCSSQLSPELGERVLDGVDGLQAFTQAVESDFSEFRYEPEELIPAGDGQVVVLGRIQAVARTSRMPLSGEFGHVWAIRDGRGVSVRAFRDREEAKRQGGL